MKILKGAWTGVLVLVIWYGCSPTMALYDQATFDKTISVKVDILDLMDSAVRPYQTQLGTIRTVNLELLKLYEYEKNRPNNSITIAQFHILMDSSSNGHLYTSFLKLWSTEKVLKSAYIEAKKEQIGKALDQIEMLESKKIRKT